MVWGDIATTSAATSTPTVTSVLSQARLSLKSTSGRGSASCLVFLPFFCKISCDRLSPGSRIKGSRIQRTLITFQRVPLAFPPEAVGVCGSSLGFETGRDEWDLIKAPCQEAWRAARGADHLHPGVGVSRGLFSPSCSYSPDKGLGKHRVLQGSSFRLRTQGPHLWMRK